MNVLGIYVEVECDQCEKGRVPGGQREYGEVVDCPLCRGRCRYRKYITLDEFRKVLAAP